jgi:sugar phosphate isomerase/epimerase
VEVNLSFLVCEPVRDLTDLASRMERLVSLGYQGIELTAKHPFDYSLDEVLSLSDRFHLPVVSLLSGWSYVNEGLCLCSPDAGVRARAVQRLTGYVAAAARLNALLVIGLMQGLRGDEPDEARANDRIAACLSEVAAQAADCGVKVVIEPVNHLQVGFNHTADEVAALVNRIGSPALGYMLDTIHMNIEERSVVDTIRRHGPHIRHFHLCETNGGPFGSGNLDFAAVLTELMASGYKGFASVKIYRTLRWDEAAQRAIEFVRRLALRSDR